MGAGCRYTNNTTKELAYWIDLDIEYDENDIVAGQFQYDDTIEDLSGIIEELGYHSVDSRNRIFSNGLFKLELESTYYADGLVIQLNPKMDEWDKEYNLAISNLERGERKILRKLLKSGYKLRIATSGYTSTEVTEV